MIHVYTGEGKGKTTAAFGLAMRASGQKLKVVIYQFLKGKPLSCGEQISTKELKGIELVTFNETHPLFCHSKVEPADLKENLKKDFDTAKKAILSEKYDMVVLDEIINVVDQGFISKKDFAEVLKNVPPKVELVLTGRGNISEIEEIADYVT
ncbi:MAG: cob(I)yrinic acid a,c-diamide adenosyltransferase, partial [Candidatus Omnitrophota bacterium]|nr:cob(I)yrinic acid a,c-diamide adenosyltransferase [Candidatus Omnitrophota bacterium]